jgi:hypothetical protein
MAGVAPARIPWWRWIVPSWRWKVVAQVEAGDQVPTRLPKHSAVLVGTGNYPKWLALDCPCRTGHRLMVNLDRGRRPYWTITTSPRLVLKPSIDSITPSRRCHFLLRDGKVTWVPERQHHGSARP